MRHLAVEVLGKIGDVKAVDSLIAALEDSRPDIRKSAAEMLDKFDWKPSTDKARVTYWIAKQDWAHCVEMGILSVKPLVAVLEEGTYDVSQAAAEALVKIGTPSVGALIAVLKYKYRNPNVWRYATEALVKIGDARVVAPLLVMLKDSDYSVRQSAADALDKLGWKPSADAASATYWIAKCDWDRCIEVGTPAVDPLIAMLEDSNSDVRQSAVKTLAKVARINMNGLGTTDAKKIVEAVAIAILPSPLRSQVAGLSGEAKQYF
jgi:HEAT repeat protein